MRHDVSLKGCFVVFYVVLFLSAVPVD